MKRILYFLVPLFIIFPISTKAFSSSATSGILMDMDSGRILYSKDIHNKRSVASISKIMTAIIAIESGKINDGVIIGKEIEEAYGSGIYIKQGEHMTLKDLLYGLMLRSGNDAALAIANYVGGDVSKFVELMNKKAQEIGMKNSEFNNPSGLDNKRGNYSTAYDMAILMSYAMKNDIFKQIVGTKRYKLETNMNYYDWTNKNKLLQNYKYCTGGKTGFTEIALRTLVTTASKDNLNLVAVTLNDGNDFNDHKNMFEEAFKNYSNYFILKAGILNIPDEKYYQDYELYVKDNITYPFNDLEKSSIKIKYNFKKLRTFNNEEEAGIAHIFINDEEIRKVPIYVRKKTQLEKNLIERLKEWINNLW